MIEEGLKMSKMELLRKYFIEMMNYVNNLNLVYDILLKDIKLEQDFL